MNSFLRLLPLVVLLMLVAALSPGVFAQSLGQSNYSAIQPLTQNGTNYLTATDLNSFAPTTIDLRWLLAFLMIGIGAFILSGRRRETTPRKFYAPSAARYHISYHDIERVRIKRKIHKFKKSILAT